MGEGRYDRRARGRKPQRPAFVPRTKNPNFILSVIMTTAKLMFLLVIITGISLSGLVMGVAKAYIETAPALDLQRFDEHAQTSFIYDRDGNLIRDFKGVENRIYASISEIPDNLRNAFVAIEDARFFDHSGVDVKRIVGAFVSNLTSNTTQGGSTITQQLIKQTLLGTEQTYKRKIQEAYLAMQLEKSVSKEEILEDYLNVIYLGGSSYGVKVAALDYFGKDMSALTLRECAMLAGLNRDPYHYNPRRNYYGDNRKQITDDRTNRVLRAMLDANFVTQAQYDDALAENVYILPSSPSSSTKLYDHVYYVEYAVYDVVTHMLIKEQLEDTTANRATMERKLRAGGYHIYTSLDPQAQEIVEKAIIDWDKYPRTRNKADAVLKVSDGPGVTVEIKQPQAAAAVYDYRLGELTAIVGGRSLPTKEKQLNRSYQSLMPVGSSIKPLSVYGPAWDMGNSPGSPVFNMPIKIDGWVSSRGYPQNYGGGQYTGVESMRTAMTKSHNTSTAQALFMYVGLENSANYLVNLGINRKHILQNGSGLALGSSGISVVEMAVAFGTIANRGLYQTPFAFRKVVDSKGEVYLDAQSEQVKRQVFKPSTAWLLVDVLKACASSKGTGEDAQFSGMTVAGKTGTNSDAKGVFFAGMTPYYSGAVWIGHDRYRPLVSNATGGKYAAPLWADIMKKLHKAKGLKDRDIIADNPEDLGLVKVSVCAVSGMLPTTACKNDANGKKPVTDWFLKGTQPDKECNMHRGIKLCTETKRSPTQYCPEVRTYGSIYIPEGHPLRKADADVVRKYLSGASTNKSASVGKCKVHTKEWYDAQQKKQEPELPDGPVVPADSGTDQPPEAAD